MTGSMTGNDRAADTRVKTATTRATKQPTTQKTVKPSALPPAARTQEAFTVRVPGGALAMIYHPAQKPLHNVAHKRPIACLILVGGPQYRVGAHRQYRDLARYLSAHGVATLRFDYLGMGDSTGMPGRLQDRGPEIEIASQELLRRSGPTTRIFPWGLCEGASAIFLHHERIENLTGAIVANPWVADPELEAHVRWRSHYLSRLNLASFTQRLRAQQVGLSYITQSARMLLQGATPPTRFDSSAYIPELPHQLSGLLGRRKPVLYLASGKDRERQTFDFAINNHPRWSEMGKSALIERVDLDAADHTFSSNQYKKVVNAQTLKFIAEQTKPVDRQIAAE